MEDIISTTNNFESKILCLSISCGKKDLDTEDCLLKIKTELNKSVTIISGGKGTADDKFAALDEANVKTVRSPSELGTAIASIMP